MKMKLKEKYGFLNDLTKLDHLIRKEPTAQQQFWNQKYFVVVIGQTLMIICMYYVFVCEILSIFASPCMHQYSGFLICEISIDFGIFAVFDRLDFHPFHESPLVLDSI